MSKNVKQSQAAKRVTKKLYFMTAEVTTNNHAIREGQRINASVTYVDEDNLRIIERPHTPHAELPERRYKDLTGSLHGKISRNDHGVLLHVYVRHGDYQNAADLADIFEREVELMCGELSEMNLKEEESK